MKKTFHTRSKLKLKITKLLEKHKKILPFL